MLEVLAIDVLSRRWCLLCLSLSRQPGGSGEAGCSGSGSSHSKSFDQLRFPPGFSGSVGDGGDSLSVTSAGSSSSDVEEVNISFISDSPDALERKVRRSSDCCSVLIILFIRQCLSRGQGLFPSVAHCCFHLDASCLKHTDMTQTTAKCIALTEGS